MTRIRLVMLSQIEFNTIVDCCCTLYDNEWREKGEKGEKEEKRRDLHGIFYRYHFLFELKRIVEEKAKKIVNFFNQNISRRKIDIKYLSG